jgi:CYTH domain-containing protein
MALEIERKFLVASNAWRPLATSEAFVQGYLSSSPDRTIRIRIRGDAAFLTIKGKSVGLTRSEFEYPIPLADARAMLQLCERPLIEKTRHRVTHAGRLWEIDEFGGENAGLIIAEVELESEHASVDLPPWIGREVSGDPRYFNSNLVKHPFRSW